MLQNAPYNFIWVPLEITFAKHHYLYALEPPSKRMALI